MRRSLLIIMTLIGVVACQPVTEPPTPTPYPTPITFAHAPQAQAPAVWLSDAGLTAAWIGMDDAGIHHDARYMPLNADAPPTPQMITLPLPPIRPHEQTALSAGQRQHLLWIDTNADNENRLYAALLTHDLQIERGPTLISTLRTDHYSAVSDAYGNAWIAWSGGTLTEPNLYLQAIDATGRPNQPQRITTNAHHPALVMMQNGDLALFWLGMANGAVYHTRISPTDTTRDADTFDETPQLDIPAPELTIAPIQQLSAGVQLPDSTRLIALSAGIDDTHAYLAWNTRDYQGNPYVWFSTGALESTRWQAPRPYLIDESNANAVAWLVMMPYQETPLHAALVNDETLHLVQFQNGERATMIALQNKMRLLAPPAITRALNRVALAWAQTTASQNAALNVSVYDLP